MQWLRRHGWLVLVVAAILSASAISVTVVFWDEPRTGIDARAERAEIVRNLGLVVGGVIALGIAVWRSKAAQDEVGIGKRDLLDRRFNLGVSLLSEKETVSRLAGIRMLDQLAELEPKLFREGVTHVLCEFARNPTAIDKSDTEAVDVLPRFRPHEGQGGDDRRAVINSSRREEIEKAVEVVSKCNTAAMAEHPNAPLEPNLAGLALYEAQLKHMNLSGADLSGAQLASVDFSNANLSGANLSSSNLAFAKLNATNLTGADLTRTILSLASLHNAQLADADLSYAELDGAVMLGVQIDNSIFTGALLSRAGVATPDSERAGEAIDEVTATGLTQAAIDQMVAADANPPRLTGILDAETGEPLEWRGRMLLPQSSTGPFRER